MSALATPFVTVAVLARETGRDPAGLSRLLKIAHEDGEVARDKQGRWHAGQARAVIQANGDPARVEGHASVGRGVAKQTTEGESYSKQRAHLAREQARKIHLANEKAAGNLVSLDDVKAAGADLVVKVGQAFMSIGHRVAGKVVGMTDTIKVAQIIEAEAALIRGELADVETFVAAILDDGEDPLA